ncbi:MAG: alkaline phosphatase family protein, partial [Opitutaceae bacterium]|nr:alkaline phosphatase family protein [Opitutaceae bacterium]
MRNFLRFHAVFLPALLLIALAAPAHGTEPEVESRSPLLLISLDGFRWDYCQKYPAETPNLRRLMAQGVTARRLTPVFPSNT